MVTQDDEAVELELSLTSHAVALLDMMSGPGNLYPDHTRESLALKWLVRWGECGERELWFLDKHGAATETVVLAVDRSLLALLHKRGFGRRWEPGEMASAVINDYAVHLNR